MLRTLLFFSQSLHAPTSLMRPLLRAVPVLSSQLRPRLVPQVGQLTAKGGCRLCFRYNTTAMLLRGKMVNCDQCPQPTSLRVAHGTQWEKPSQRHGTAPFHLRIRGSSSNFSVTTGNHGKRRAAGDITSWNRITRFTHRVRLHLTRSFLPDSPGKTFSAEACLPESTLRALRISRRASRATRFSV